MSLKEFRLPDIGEGIAEGEIVSWKVQAGQQIKEEDEFVEVMTDKATVMITAPYTGVVKELKAAEGDIVPVESVIAVFDTSEGGSAPAADSESKEEPKEKESKETKPKEKESEKASEAPAPQAASRAQQAESKSESSNGSTKFEQAEPGKVLAAPATRQRAREMGLDLHQVRGTGPSGRITNEDLARHAADSGATAPQEAAGSGAGAAAPAPKQFAPVSIAGAPQGATEERVPFRGLRRKIAEAMTRSEQTAVHFTYVDDLDVTKLVELRKQAKARYQEHGVNVTYLPFIMKAVVEAHRQFPMMNSSLDESTQELVVKHYYNFGIATDTDQGLIVPVIQNVDQKSIAQLAREIQEMAQATREGKLGVDRLTGGTFTLTNAGNIGGLFATPVINFPEVAILGVHAIKKAPVVNDNDEIVVGSKMYLSVSIDHRIVDGATGARWMNVIKECLEDPQVLLLGSI